MDDEDMRTIWCGNLSEKVTEELLYELFLQAGPLQSVRIPKKHGKQCAYGFVTYKHECSVCYAIELFKGTELFRRELNMNTRNTNRLIRNQQLETPSHDNFNRYNNRPGNHFRSQSAPIKCGPEPREKPPADVNFDSLMLLGQQMFVNAPATSSLTMGPNNLYSSQRGTSHYFGGSKKFGDGLAERSLQGNWSSRNHPYSRNDGHGGHRRHSDNRGNHYRQRR